jgi:uncharacterized protein YlzI (FlbEa/FlbD family)
MTQRTANRALATGGLSSSVGGRSQENMMKGFVSLIVALLLSPTITAQKLYENLDGPDLMILKTEWRNPQIIADMSWEQLNSTLALTVKNTGERAIVDVSGNVFLVEEATERVIEKIWFRENPKNLKIAAGKTKTLKVLFKYRRVPDHVQVKVHITGIGYDNGKFWGGLYIPKKD